MGAFPMTCLKRATLDRYIDWVRWRLDRWPKDYQPIPWLGVHDATRSEGAFSRWSEIERVVSSTSCRTALDIGANAGFFAVAASINGMTTLAVEGEPRYIRSLLYAKRRLNLDDLGVAAWWISTSTVEMLPSADCVMFLAVWHHLVHDLGLDDASFILRELWSRTRVALFFETGELEMSGYFNLPFGNQDPVDYLVPYLSAQCIKSRVLQLGKHQAFSPDGSKCSRSLYAILREQ